MKLIVGLGNPEDRYAGTRHNLGFEVVDELARKLKLGDWSQEEKFKSQLVKTADLILIKPQTYMNNSGMAVSLVQRFYKISPEDVVVIHDDLDLLLGKIKVRIGGGAAGHHGVESVINALGDQFIRVRLGIGNTEGFLGEHNRASFNAEKFVVDPFSSSERSKAKAMIKHAVGAVEILLTEGLDKTQNQFN